MVQVSLQLHRGVWADLFLQKLRLICVGHIFSLGLIEPNPSRTRTRLIYLPAEY